IVHGVDRSLGIGRGRADVTRGLSLAAPCGLAVSAVAIPERPALLVVEGIGGLDQADPGPVVLDDALARGPLALQRREARPGGLQLPLEGDGFFSRRVREAGLLLAALKVLDPRHQHRAVGLVSAAPGVHPLQQPAPLLLRSLHRPAQPRYLTLPSPGL